ncbi:MAG: hypothetical protein ACI4OT_00860 [Bacilli bacterium]
MKSEYIDIVQGDKVVTYKVSYDPVEMYYFYKEFENQDTEQVNFEVALPESVIKNEDLTIYTPVDEIIKCERNYYAEDNLYKIHGIGVKLSPFINAISSVNGYKGFNLIGGIRDNILRINNFLLEKNSMDIARKRALANYYFCLFQDELVNEQDIEDFEPVKNTEEYQLWIMDVYELTDAIKNIESNKVKVLGCNNNDSKRKN